MTGNILYQFAGLQNYKEEHMDKIKAFPYFDGSCGVPWGNHPLDEYIRANIEYFDGCSIIITDELMDHASLFWQICDKNQW